MGGVPTSQHMEGQAADLTVGSNARNKELIRLIQRMRSENGFQYDQLINEHGGSWVHVSYKTSGNRNSDLSIS